MTTIITYNDLPGTVALTCIRKGGRGLDSRNEPLYNF